MASLFTRECPAVEPGQSLGGAEVVVCCQKIIGVVEAVGKWKIRRIFQGRATAGVSTARPGCYQPERQLLDGFRTR